LLNGLRDFSEKQQEEGPLLSLNLFMEDIALLTNEDRKDDEEDTDRVLLMTIHAAKGLEFNYVYIAGLEENLFPSQMSIMSREDLEEERRLFYVALTRAKKKANLSYSISRYRYGSSLSCEPSRFLEEIPAEFIENVAQLDEPTKPQHWQEIQRIPRSFNPQKTTNGTPPVIKSPLTNKKLVSINKASSTAAPVNNEHLNDLKIGMHVEHERFGKGEVVTMEGNYPNSKAVVIFENGEKKQLLLRFARLKIVG